MEPTIDTEAPVENPASDEDITSIDANKTDSLEQETKTKILIKGIGKGGDDGKTDVLEDSLSTAEIQFTDGCASNDGTQVRADADITFRVLTNDGCKIEAVKYNTAETEEALNTLDGAKTLTEKNGIYTIPKTEINKGDKKYHAMIAVKTVETKFTVKGSSLGTIEEKEVNGEATTVFTPFSSKEVGYKEAGSFEFALKVTAGTSYEVTANAEGSDKSIPVDMDEPVEIAKEIYIPCSLDIFKLDGVKKDGDQNILISVKALEAVKISGTTVDYTPGYATRISAPTIPAEEKTTFTYAEDGKYDPNTTVVFALDDPADKSAWDKVTADDIDAKLVDTADNKKVIEELEVSVSDIEKTGATVFAVAIPETVEKSCTLKIAVNAKMNDTAKKLTFNLKLADGVNSSVVTMKSGDAVIENGKEIRTEGTTYPVSITTKEGYQLTGVVVSVEGTYDGTEDTYTNEEGYSLENEDEDDPDDTEYPRYAVNAEIKLTGTDDRDGENKNKKWTATKVTVSVNVAEVEGADEDKEVLFVSDTEKINGHPYEVTVAQPEDGSVTYKDGLAKIKEGTKYLSFTVKAEKEPKVMLQTNQTAGGDDSDLLELVSEEGGVFSYRVAAKAIIDTKGKITVTRQKKMIEADFGNNAEVTFTNAEDDSETKYTLNNGVSADIDINAPLSVEVTRKANADAAPIASVTYQVGEEAEQQAQSDGEGGFFFEVKASENIKVVVTNAAEERLFVNGTEYGTEETIPVDYESTITACLKDKDSNNVALLNATVYDDKTLAETVAKIDEFNNVSIDVAKKERATELTVTLLKKDRTAISFKIASDKAVEEVSYTDMGGTPVSGSIALNEDTTIALRINAKDGNMDKLHAAVVDTADPKEIPANPSEYGKNVSAYIYNGILYITANAMDSGVEKAGTILLYEAGDAKTILTGSALSVKVNDPIMKGQTASASFKSADARNITISIDVPAEVRNESLNDGELYYLLKVTAPTLTKPESLTETEWKDTKASIEANTKTERKLTLDDINEGYTVPIIGKSAKAAKIDGFKIVVTPAQTVNGKEVKGTACAEFTAGTTAPVYSDTLKLKADAKELITGQDKAVPVAIPDFAAIAEYKTVVVPEIIDSTTGYRHAEAADFVPAWDAVNGKVTVNAKNATAENNAQGLYKNLAVKVTVYTETGDYGVSGVQKLNVINGIESMNVSVQPEIIKADAKKAVKVKTAVVYNSEGRTDVTWAKKTAPKKKIVEYSLAGDEYGAPLGATLKGNVSIDQKSGQITIEKDFVPSGKEAENTFVVRVKAADYDGNQYESYSNDILITTKDTAKGELAIFEASTDKSGKPDWTKATKVSAGDLQVKKPFEQYRLAMLKPNAPAKTTYNLDVENGANVNFIDNDLYTIKASGKNVVVDNETGDIEVKKLGKVTFTMAAKSNAKNKAELKNVNFVLEKTDLYVQVSQYHDSTFAQKGVIVKRANASDSFEVKGNTTSYFRVDLMKKIVDAKGKEDWRKFALSDGVISVKNGKKVTPMPASVYDAPAYVMATGTTGKKATVISVKSKSAGKTIDITISNPTADTLTGNAPKIALTDKKQRIPAGTGGEVNLTVTMAKKGEILPDNTYIMLSVDQTKKTKANVNNVFDESLETAIPLHKTGSAAGTFSVKMTKYCQAENYNLIATLGTLKNGEFTQTHKEAKVTLKAVKGNINIKATGKYTLNPYGVSSQKLAVSGGDYDVWYDSDPITQEIGTGKDKKTYENYAKNIIQKDGNPNEFNKYFMATWDEKKGEIGEIMINPTLELKDYANLESKDFLKTNGTGYITVTNGQKVMDIKLTIAVNGKEKLKLKATAAPVLAGKDVITDVQVLDGKNPVALAAYTADGTSFKQYYDDATAKKEEKEAEADRLANGIIRMKAADVAKGTDTLTLKVLPAGVAAAYGSAQDSLKNYGIDIAGVKVKIDAADKKNKVSLAAADKKWKVENSDWAATAERAGWATVKDYTFTNRLSVACVTSEKDSGQVINVTTTTPYVTFASDRYNASGAQKLEIFLDKAKLAEAMQADPKKVNYNKTVKVDAIFTYPDKADETKTLLKEDKVTFNITLPDKEGFASGGELAAAIEAAMPELQEMADIRTTQYEKSLKENKYTKDDVANDVAKDLEAYVLNLAQGTAAVIGVSGVFKDSVYTYTLTVDSKTWTIGTKGLAGAGDVITALSTNGYLTVTDQKKANELGLAFRPATTDETLTANLYEVLKDKKVLTSNIIVSAKVDTKELKAPTTSAPGKFKAAVTVIDKRFEPRSNNSDGNYLKTRPISFEFATLKENDVYLSLTGNESLKKKLEAPADEDDKPVITGTTKLEYFFSESYKEVPKGIGEAQAGQAGAISKEMQDALKKRIEEYAAELILENPYLKVQDIKDFACTPSGSDWSVAFTIVYTDEASEKPVDIEVALTDTNKLTVTAAQVPRLQDAGALLTRAEEAFADARMLLDKADTKEDAINQIKAIILGEDVCLNPNYDGEKSLEVTAGDDDFVAPEGDKNGQITVSVAYDNDTKGGATVTGEYTFVIVSNNELKGETPGEEEGDDPTPNLTDEAKYQGLIKAALSDKRVNQKVQDAWKAFVEKAENATDWNKFIDSGAKDGLESTITGLVTDSLKGDKVVGVASSNGVTLASGSKKPAGAEASDTKGEIGKITVKLVKTVESTEVEVATVEIPSIALNPDDVFQSEEQFIKAVTDDLQANGIGYDVSFFTLTGEEGNKKPEISSDENKGAVIKAITDRANSKDFADNPQWKQSSYTIAAAKVESESDGKDTDFSDITEVKNVKLTFGLKDAVKIDVPIRTKENTDLIEDVKIAKIGDKTVAGEEVKDAVELTAGTDKEGSFFPLTVQKKLTSGTGFVDATNVTWEIKSVDKQGSNEAPLANGLANIEVKDGELFVPQNAYADGGEAWLKLTATVNDNSDKPLEDDDNVATAFVNLKLPETVAITLKAGDEDVTAESALTFEAPATGADDIVVNFIADVTGSHINTKATTAAITKPTDIDGKVTFTQDSGTSALEMTIKPAVDEKKTIKLTITAGDVEKEVTLNIISNDEAKDAAKLSFEADGTDSLWTAPEGEGATAKNGVLTVQNTTEKDVEVLITGADGGRTWDTKKVTDAEGTAVTGVSVEKVDGKVYLKVANTVGEIKAAYTPEGEDDKTPEVKATTWTLTLTSKENAGKGQAAITREIEFDIVVKRTIEKVVVTRDEDAETDTEGLTEVAGRTQVTMPESGNAQVTLEATLKGAHVADNNGVTWKIVSKGAKSRAKIAADKDGKGVLTIPEDSIDNTIKVQATSKDKNEDGNAKSGVYTIKVVTE